jgi:endosialidase-like protein
MTVKGLLCVLFLGVVLPISLLAQQQRGALASATVVPRLVNFSGQATDGQGKVFTGSAGVTFAIYKDQYDGAPLWMETQNVQADARGNYSVQLGATRSEGLPLELFASGEARWLGVRINGGEEQPRVLLLSVPYALKAADAETVGGLPPAAFMLAPLPTSNGSSTATPSTTPQPLATGTTPVTTAAGTVNKLAKFDASADITNSQIFDNGTNVGIGNTAPAAKLDVSGAATVRGLLYLPPKGTATATTAYTSQPIRLTSSVFNSSTAAAVAQNFQWQAEVVGNNTATPTGRLSLLYASGTNTLAETGLKINSTGQIQFAAGQTFPGTGTIAGITTATGSGLTGGGTSGTLNLRIDTTKVPLLAAANTFTGNQTVNGNLSATGVVAGSSYEIGSNLFAFGSYANQNAFLGFAGNTTTTGGGNTASGWEALLNNSTGLNNAAHGTEALQFNTTGSGNTAIGSQALQGNNAGNYNTASGAYALILNTTGSDNTAAGYQALYGNIKGTDNTANGYQALYYNKGSGNTAVGSQALLNNYGGSGNTATGYQALYANTSGQNNTADGYQALHSMTYSTGNTATGYQALYSTPGSADNTADGYQALYADTTGLNNVAVGIDTLYSNIGGNGNTAVGGSVLYSNLFSAGNTGVGAGALYSAQGPNNTAVGVSAVADDQSGQGNTGVGFEALYSSLSGDYLTCIGYQCTVNAASNATAIGAFATVGESNALVLGGTGSHAVKVGIGTPEPSNVLTIGRGLGHPVSDSWETYSSRRWKTNIHTLNGALGKVEQLRGVSYDLKDSGKHEIGVIAEEVGAVVPEVVAYEKNGTDAQGVDYGRLTALLIEAVKQQQKQLTEQRQVAQQQQRQIAAQREQILKLRSQDVLLQGKLTQLLGKVEELRQAKTSASAVARNRPAAVAKAQF